MANSALKIGWAQGDITPDQPVMLRGVFYARVSEGIMDPLSVTAWALESEGEHAVLVSCDLISISDALRDKVRACLDGHTPNLDPMKVMISATHTHTAPEVHEWFGVELDTMTVEQYLDFAAKRIAKVVGQAWNSRTLGSFAYGMDYAVAGRNRRWINHQGMGSISTPRSEEVDTFRHFEGYEDHSVNVVATYNRQGKLTGLVVNVPCPSQLSQSLYVISADWWYETRRALRAIYGEELFILPQCSAAGELTPFSKYEVKANERMLALKGRTAREELAQRIVHAVQQVVPYIAKTADSSPVLEHRVQTLEVPAYSLKEEDVRSTEKEVERWREQFTKEMHKLEVDPDIRKTPRWYVASTNAFRRMNWNAKVARRYEAQKTNPSLPAEIHIVRLGDIVFTSVPYECYLDFGIQIKVRSKAVQTFIVQLTGAGTYLPSARSINAAGYGSTAASSPVGPEGGQYIVEHTVCTIREMFANGEGTGNG